MTKVLDALHYTGPRDRDNYKVICPAHDDDKPSLSVSGGDNGGVVLHCHAGCKTEAILARLDLTWADLAPEDRQNGTGPHTAKTAKRQIVAEYDYRGPDGRTVFQTVRFEPKGFAQRQPDGRGGWEWNLRGVTLVPYRLPELLAAPAQDWIFVVEGEKDADNLARLGLVATCNAQGAGKWRAEYNEHFQGRRVCILPDNDDPGRKHAKQVAEHLRKGAATVRILELPNLTPKGDVSDWLATGGTAADLLALVEKSTNVVGRAAAIRQALAERGYSFRLNLLRERIEHPNGQTVHDGEQAQLIAELYDSGLSNRELMQTVILADAWAHRYDPLVDFLQGLTWDGVDHIARLGYHFEDRHPLIEYPDNSKRTVFAAWLRRWLIGAVAKGLGDAVQNPMLVLAGEQEIGKSEFARWLCSPLPDYFVESAISPDSVDHQRWATGNFVWEVGELGATTRKADVEALKAFITRHEHSYRVPYAKNEVHKKTRASFIGTVNPDNAGFLTDTTGNRRFLTVEVTAIDWKGYSAKIDVRQVWAQARAIYANAPRAWQLDEAERATRDRINNEFAVEDPVRDAILKLFEVTPAAGDDAPFTSNSDLAFFVGNEVRANSTKSLQMDIARALKGMGVTKGRAGQIRGYFGVKKLPTNVNHVNLMPTSGG